MSLTKHLHRSKLTPTLRFNGFNEKWEKKKLGEVSEFLDGRRKPIKSEDRAKMKGEYPYYGASGIIDYVNEFIFDEEIILLGEDGENIVSRNLPLAFRVSGKCWINNHAHVIRNNKGTDIGFLTYVLELTNYSIYNTGTAQPKLNQEVCRNITLYFPSLPEQKKIASFLSAIDEKIQQLTRKKELLEQYKKGVMQRLFMSGLGFVGFEDDRIVDDTNPKILSSKKPQFRPLRFKDENGKAYPKWEEKYLGDLVKVIQSGVSRKLNDTDIGLPVIRSNNLQNGKIDVSEIKYWSLVDDQGADLENYVLREGDLLVNFINSLAQIGKVAVYRDLLKRKTIFTTNILRLSFNDMVLPNYIFNYFQLKRYSDFIQSITKPAVNQASFTTKEFKKFKIQLPSIEEQQKIATYLTSIDTKIESLTTQITLTQTFKKGLLQQMFV